MTKQFWMIANPNAGPPTRRHESREAADAEARRLARVCPGETFIILEAVCAVTLREFDVTEFRRAPAPEARRAQIDSDLPL